MVKRPTSDDPVIRSANWRSASGSEARSTTEPAPVRPAEIAAGEDDQQEQQPDDDTNNPARRAHETSRDGPDCISRASAFVHGRGASPKYSTSLERNSVRVELGPDCRGRA